MFESLYPDMQSSRNVAIERTLQLNLLTYVIITHREMYYGLGGEQLHLHPIFTATFPFLRWLRFGECIRFRMLRANPVFWKDSLHKWRRIYGAELRV